MYCTPKQMSGNRIAWFSRAGEVIQTEEFRLGHKDDALCMAFVHHANGHAGTHAHDQHHADIRVARSATPASDRRQALPTHADDHRPNAPSSHVTGVPTNTQDHMPTSRSIRLSRNLLGLALLSAAAISSNTPVGAQQIGVSVLQARSAFSGATTFRWMTSTSMAVVSHCVLASGSSCSRSTFNGLESEWIPPGHIPRLAHCPPAGRSISSTTAPTSSSISAAPPSCHLPVRAPVFCGWSQIPVIDRIVSR